MIRKLLSSVLLLSFFAPNIMAQKDTLKSPFVAGNGSAIITFNFKNTNAYPVIISEVGSISSSTAIITVEGWYSTTPLAGTFVAPTVPNGWIQFGSGTIPPGVANVVRTFFPTATSTMTPITVAPGATIGFNIGATSLQYANTTGSPLVTTKAGCEFISGTGIGFGGTNASTIADRGFVGYLIFEPAGPCQNPPVIPTIATNSTSVCSGVNFTLSLNGGSGGTGQTYQWESSPDGTTWAPISGATSASYTGNQSDTTSYRVVVSCGVSVTTTPITLYTDASPLSGVYTLNAALPTSSTNFQTFSTFSQKLTCNGVSGPVTLNVVSGSGPYTEQVNFGIVVGVSGTNTITINGNGETLQFAPTAGDRHVVKLDGTDYITINNLKVKGTDPTYGWGIFLTNSADYVTIQNCTVDLSAITSTSSLNSGGIVVSGSTTSMVVAGNNANVCRILNNTIKGGASGAPYYGITMNGSTSGLGGISCEIKGNTVQDFYYGGIYSNATQGILIENNDISRPNFNTTGIFYGMYLTGGQIAGKINANRIHNTNGANPTSTGSVYGIYVANGGGFSQNLIVSNNLVYKVNNNGILYALYLSSAKNVDILHNSIVADNVTATGTSTARGFYFSGTNDSISIKNNIVAITRGGTGSFYGFYISPVPSTWEESNNNIYVNSATGVNYFGYATANRQTLLDWQSFTSQGVADQTVLPIFNDAANGDLTPSAASLNNAGADVLSLVSKDILGVTRTTTPDIGAYEFTPITDDAGATLITTENCAGAQSIFVKVRNFGLVPLTNVVVSALFNGVATSASGNTFNLNLVSGADTTLDLGTFNFAANTSYNGVAFTNLPNGNVDGNRSNDTANLANFNLGLNGTYTVNSAVVTGGLNFQTFTALADALNDRGVCGPVVVNTVVGSGPYNEQVMLDEVKGTSAINTITIHGNGETLTFLSSLTSQRAGFSLNGTDYITIDSFNIVAQGTTTSNYGFGVHLIAQADYNTIKNNTITVDSITTSLNYAGIVISGTSSSATSAGANGNYNIIENNTIIGGYYGISSYGQSTTIHTKGNSFLKNKIYGFYYYGLTSYYQDSVEIEDNTVVQRSASSTSYGIYPYYSNVVNVLRNNVVLLGTSTQYGIYPYYSNDIKVLGNKVVNQGTGTQYGIYPYYVNVNGIHAGNSLIANNFITCQNATTSVYGIYPYNCRDLNIYHNSVNVFGGSATAGRAFYVNSSTGAYNIEVMNNIFVNEGLGYGVEISAASNTNNYVTRMDNNNIYVPNGTLTRLGTTNYFTLADWTTASKKDTNSFNVVPLFNSPTDLHVVSNVLNNNGAIGLGVSDDIDGDVRCPLAGCAGSTLRPDIGADEFLGAPITVDLGIDELVSPALKSCYSNAETVSVKIHNYNNSTIYFNLDPATVQVSSTGTNPIVFPAVTLNSDSLMSDSTRIITLPGTYDMSALGTYDFTAIISQVDDVIKYNDTVNSSVIFTAGTLAETYKQVCSGSSHTLRLNGVNPPIQWQSFNTILNTWVNETGIGNDSTHYTVTPSTNTIYRALVCGTYDAGSDTVEVFVTPTPVGVNDTICGAGVASLSASVTSGTLKWYADATTINSLATGNTYSPTVTATDTFYVQNSDGGAGITSVGLSAPLPNPTSGAGTTNFGIVFDALAPFVLQSVDVYAISSTAGTTGTVTIEVVDGTGAVVHSAIVPVTGNPIASRVAETVTLNFAIVPGTNYKLRPSARSTGISGLAFDPSAGAPAGNYGFPFSVPGVVTLRNSTLTAPPTNTPRLDLYYYFYNWQIKTGCESPRIPVVAVVTPAPIVNLGVDTAICIGASVVFNAGNVGDTYLWNNTTTAQTLSANASGTYSVAVTNASGCVGRDTVVLNVVSNPEVNLGNDTAICAGSSLTLDAGNAGSSYTWSTGANTRTVSATTANTYSVVVTNATGCKGKDTLVLSLNAKPIVNLGADTTICTGASVTLNAGNVGSSYTWSTGVSSQTVSATTANTYSVEVTNAAGCKGNDTVVISLNALPIVTITASRDTICKNAGTITLTGTPIGGVFSGTNVTGNSFNSTTAGSQMVNYAVTDVNGCSNSTTKNLVVIICTGIENTSEIAATVYPVPMNSELFVALPALTNNTTITLYAADGKLVMSRTIDASAATKERIDVAKFAAGIYTLRVVSGSQTFSSRLIKE